MKIAIADCNALGHIVKYATKTLSFRGNPTGVIFGFLRKIFLIQKSIEADVWVFCWDSTTGYERELIYPQYKENRKEKSPSDKTLNSIALPQFTRLREEILPKIGFKNIFMIPGLEADDLIAQITFDYKVDNSIIIVSRDSDLYQLLDGDRGNPIEYIDKVSIFNPVDMKYFGENDLVREFGVFPKKWNMIKAIAGCGGDNVEGVENVAEKTAAKFLLGLLKPTTLSFQKIVSAEELIVNNLRLVTLPWENTPKIILMEDELNTDGYLDVCKATGMRSLLDSESYDIYKSMIVNNIK